ncbi:hypothetical protein Tco_0277976 [Tanacetum coccineum]
MVLGGVGCVNGCCGNCAGGGSWGGAKLCWWLVWRGEGFVLPALDVGGGGGWVMGSGCGVNGGGGGFVGMALGGLVAGFLWSVDGDIWGLGWGTVWKGVAGVGYSGCVVWELGWVEGWWGGGAVEGEGLWWVVVGGGRVWEVV